MQVVKSVPFLLSGAVIWLSCGDNWHLSADAAVAVAVDTPNIPDAPLVCDCPATEPPLTGRFVAFSQTRTLTANGRGVMAAGCPAGMQFISGNCVVDNATTRFNVSIEQSGVYDVPPTNWHCVFHNNEPMSVSFRVFAICLKPTP